MALLVNRRSILGSEPDFEPTTSSTEGPSSPEHMHQMIEDGIICQVLVKRMVDTAVPQKYMNQLLQNMTCFCGRKLDSCFASGI